MYCTTLSDELAGPPRVITNGSVKSWKAPIICSTNRKKVVGLISGSVTLRKRCQALAPSVLAASYSSCGTPCSAAR